jgi:oligosaccharide repeat unit polymerase
MQIAAVLMVGLTIFMLLLSPLKWLSPGAILAGGWASIYVLQSLFADDMYSSPLATSIVFTISLSFALGELLGCAGLKNVELAYTHHRQPAADSSDRIEGSSKPLGWVILFFSVCGLIAVVVYAKFMGILGARSLAQLIIMPGIARERLFEGDLQVPAYGRVGFLLAYSGAVLALVYYFLYRWRWWLILPMLTVILMGVIQAGRAGSMVVILQLIIVVYLKTLLIKRHGPLKALSNSLAMPVLLLLAVFIGGSLLRQGFSSTKSSDIWRIVYSFRGYLFGGVSAFSFWIQNMYDWGTPALGKFSFSSLYGALHLAKVAPNVYDYYAPLAKNGDTSNLFTAYRSFIEDFTVFGTCFVYFVAGFSISTLTQGYLNGRRSLIAILIPLLSWLAFSPMYSLTYFNSFLLCFIAPYLIVRSILKGQHAEN